MCGFTGLLTANTLSSSAKRDVQAALSSIEQRGPDQSGIWDDKHVCLGHQRLSIHDLSEGGRQPMLSRDGRYALVFNGEIYNFEVLRQRLEAEGVKFKGDSDTEVLLAAIYTWGLEKSLRSSIGMFAFALWDTINKELTLARDRFGEKPLYYGEREDRFLFGSQINALPSSQWRDSDIDLGSLALYFRHGYIPTPRSIYKGVYKLEPGCYLKVVLRPDGLIKSEPKKYWDAHSFLKRDRDDLGLEGAATKLDELISSSVEMQSKSDVPLGCFLSGGIDSSTVASVLQAQSSAPIDTFTIGFDDPAYNEADFAKEIARHIGSNHHELYVSENHLLDVVPAIPNTYDEPFSDASQIPTYLVGRLAKTHVTVSLSGDGGDELFMGYNRYFSTINRWKKLQRVPGPVKSASGFLADKLGERFAYSGAKLLKDAGRAFEYTACTDFSSFYRRNVSSVNCPDRLIVNGCDVFDAFLDKRLQSLDPTDFMMAVDSQHYMMDDILVKVDRAFMASSLEGRVPLLDHRIFEFAWSIPISVHTSDGRGKYLLRRVLDKYVPRELYDRPKRGFGVPLAKWLRNDLKEWAYTGIQLSGSELNRELISKLWAQHQSGKVDWSGLLWSIVCYNYWKAEALS